MSKMINVTWPKWTLRARYRSTVDVDDIAEPRMMTQKSVRNFAICVILPVLHILSWLMILPDVFVLNLFGLWLITVTGTIGMASCIVYVWEWYNSLPP